MGTLRTQRVPRATAARNTRPGQFPRQVCEDLCCAWRSLCPLVCFPTVLRCFLFPCYPFGRCCKAPLKLEVLMVEVMSSPLAAFLGSKGLRVFCVLLFLFVFLAVLPLSLCRHYVTSQMGHRCWSTFRFQNVAVTVLSDSAPSGDGDPCGRVTPWVVAT